MGVNQFTSTERKRLVSEDVLRGVWEAQEGACYLSQVDLDGKRWGVLRRSSWKWFVEGNIAIVSYPFYLTYIQSKQDFIWNVDDTELPPDRQTVGITIETRLRQHATWKNPCVVVHEDMGGGMVEYRQLNHAINAYPPRKFQYIMLEPYYNGYQTTERTLQAINYVRNRHGLQAV